MPTKTRQATTKRKREPRVRKKPHPYGVNDKQWRFVIAYVGCLNASKSARLAGYSVHTSAEIGSQNLRKPAIAAAIEYLQAKRAQIFDITADKVLQELGRLAFTPDEEMPDRKVADQIKALDLLGRYLQLWVPKVPGSTLIPGGDTDDVRGKLLKMMADMARREAVDIHAKPDEDAQPALAPPIEKETADG